MVDVARGTKGQSLSACYLLVATVLVMILVFTVEAILFPAKCSSCNSNSPDQSGLIVNIGKTRPLVPRPLEDSSRKVDAEGTKIYEAKQSAEVSDVHLTKTPRAAAVKDKESTDEKLLDSNESKVDNARKPKEESHSEQNEGSAAKAPPRPPVRSVDSNESKVDNARKPKEESDSEQNEGSAAKAPPPRPPVRSTWYYTKVYKHPEPELRLLTAEDGAPRLRSNISAPSREITIVTQTSVDRLPAVEATCLTWGGAIVIAVYVRLQSEVASAYEVVKQLHDRVEERSGCRLDVQFVTEDGFETDEEALKALYPVNALRNVALGMAETKLIFLLDADFKPSPRLHESLTEDEATYQDLLRKATEGRTLFVVPAFEAGRRRRSPVEVPETMEELRKGWEDKTIECFHCSKTTYGHMPTKFEKFLDPETTDPYSITYKFGFEPYVIGALDVIPQYDGRFRGYAENKISHFYACAADGMDFIVLPNVFIFELPHPPSKDHDSYLGKHKDPDQRVRYIGLFNQFKSAIAKEQKEKDPERFKQFLVSSRPI